MSWALKRMRRASRPGRLDLATWRLDLTTWRLDLTTRKA
jgi:hypothetical protein